MLTAEQVLLLTKSCRRCSDFHRELIMALSWRIRPYISDRWVDSKFRDKGGYKGQWLFKRFEIIP